MSKYEKLAKDIVQNIGGVSNVSGLTHCVTRLRFQLKDESKADDEKIKALDGVIAVIHTAGQYQIVIGNTVPQVFAQINKDFGLGNVSVKEDSKNKGLKEKMMDLITGIIMPSLTLLCACGMIKGLDSVLQYLGVYSATDGICVLISAVGDSIFYFFPVVIGYNMAKQIQMRKPYIGLIIGAALCYPTINGVDVNVFGWTINSTYTATLLPVVLIVAFAKPLETFFDKIIPDVIKSFVTPMLVLLISVPTGFCVIGPIANGISNGISNGAVWLYALSPIVAGLVIGAAWQVMIVFGVHIVLVVLCITNIMNGTPDPILPFTTFVAFSTTGSIFAIWLKTKNKTLKDAAFPAGISGLFGVTEPAIYGILLPNMKQFVITCINGALTGAVVAVLNMRYYTMAGMGIFEIPALLNPENPGKTAVQCVITAAAALVLGFVVSYLTYKDHDMDGEEKKEIETKDDKKETLASPAKGKVLKLSEVSDETFSSGVLGNGIAVVPSEGDIYAPCDGTVVSVFPTKHAINIMSSNGAEILIHLGIDTVKLEGKYFEIKVEAGDTVKKGQLIAVCDIEKITAEGYSMETPVVIINSSDYLEIVDTKNSGESVKNGEDFMTLLK